MRIWILGRIFILSLLLSPALSAQEIYFNPAGLPDLVDDIRYAAWIWRTRTGIDVRYAGETDQDRIQGAIVLRQGTETEWADLGFTPPGSESYGSEDGNGHYLIRFSPYYVFSYPGLVMHEIGHVLGFWPHLGDPDTIMTAYIWPPYVVTTQDALRVIENRDWDQTNRPDLCSAQVLPNFDLFIPDMDGREWYLQYSGNNHWRLRTVQENRFSQGCKSARLENGVLTVASTKSPNTAWHIVLLPAGVMEWTLARVKKADPVSTSLPAPGPPSSYQ